MTTTYTITGYRVIFDDDTDERLSFDNVELAVTFDDAVTDISYSRFIFDNGLTEEDAIDITPEPLAETIDGIAVDDLHGALDFVRNIEVLAVPGGDQVVILQYYFDDSLTEFGAGDITVEYEFWIGGAQLPLFDNFLEYDNVSPDDIIGPGPDEDFSADQLIPLDSFNWDNVVDNQGDPFTTYYIDGFRAISQQFSDENGDFQSSQDVNSTPVTLSFTLPTTTDDFTYELEDDPFDDGIYPNIEATIDPTFFFDGVDESDMHPDLFDQRKVQFGEFTWSGGTTQVLNLYYDDFEASNPVEVVFDYTFFIGGAIPPVSTQAEYLEFLADEFDIDLDTISDEDLEAFAQETFGTPTGDFAPGETISLADLNLGTTAPEVVTGTPDLEVDNFMVEGDIERGAQVQVSYTVTNTGSGPASEAPVEIWLANFEFTQINLATIAERLPLAPGESRDYTYAVTLPSEIEAGSYLIDASVDLRDVVDESDEFNNLSNRVSVSFEVEGIELIGDNDDNELIGDEGPDTINGDRGDDTITAGGGDDDIRGGVGEDSIDGGDGNDFLRGGIGEDTILGGDGNDQIRGQKNADTLEGGAGNDNIKGGGGNDSLSGGEGNDFLKGGTRRDSIEGGEGNDRLFGNSFDDFLSGGSGNDVLNGGGDNDTLNGGLDDDRLKGGAGEDIFLFEANMGADLIQDFELGVDTLQLSTALVGAATTGEEVEQLFGGIEDGLAVLDFGDGNVITFGNLNSEVGLGADIEILFPG